MPLGLWNLQWLSLNSQRKYPLADDATGVDTTGSFTLPDDFLLELDLPVSAGMNVDPSRFLLSSVGSFGAGYSLVIGYSGASSSTIVPVASALVPRQGFTRNSVYTLGGISPFQDTVGKLTIGTLDSLDLQPGGLFGFNLAGARLDPDAVRPILRGVTALYLVNGSSVSAPIYGDVQLIAGTNIQLVPISSGDTAQIQINAISGEGTVADCSCTGNAAALPCITQINGVPPTPAGDFTLAGDNCLAFTAQGNGLQLSDSCSAPCCGCSELESITQDFARYQQQMQTLTGFINNLSASVTQMDQIVLGARLGDRGCSTC